MGFSPGGRLCSVTREQPPPQGLKPHLKSPDAALKRRSSTVLLTFRILTSHSDFCHFFSSFRLGL